MKDHILCFIFLISHCFVITLFKSVTMLHGTDIILQNIRHIQSERWSILQSNVYPVEHRYESG